MKLLAAMLLLASLAAGADWKPLFNGKDMSGWKMVGPGRFVFEDGMLKTEGGMGLLWYTPEKLGNCTLRIVFKTTGPRDNSGVYIRMAEPPPDPWYGVHNGYEVQIDATDTPDRTTGAVYGFQGADVQQGVAMAARDARTGRFPARCPASACRSSRAR